MSTRAKIKVTVLNTETKQTGETVVPFRVTRACQATNHWRLLLPTPWWRSSAFPRVPTAASISLRSSVRGKRRCIVPAATRAEHRPRITSMSRECGQIPNTLCIRKLQPKRSAKKVRKYRSAQGWWAFKFGRFNVIVPRNDDASKCKTVPILFSSPGRPLASMATDTEGNVLWYMRGGRNVTRILPGGTFLAFNSGVTSLAEVDLVGNTLRETDINRLQEQLEPFGIKSVCKPNGQQCASGFHHEAIGLPNGHIIVVGSVRRHSVGRSGFG